MSAFDPKRTLMKPRKTWGIVRRIYLGVGVVGVVLATSAAFLPGSLNPLLLLVLPALIVCAAVFADDELFNRIHRIVWRREWPK
jgi:hypothetical protein